MYIYICIYMISRAGQDRRIFTQPTCGDVGSTSKEKKKKNLRSGLLIAQTFADDLLTFLVLPDTTFYIGNKNIITRRNFPLSY